MFEWYCVAFYSVVNVNGITGIWWVNFASLCLAAGQRSTHEMLLLWYVVASSFHQQLWMKRPAKSSGLVKARFVISSLDTALFYYTQLKA